MALLLNDKVSIITGGAVGIGRASALAFAREGSKVVVADVSRKGGQETVDLIRKTGADATFIPCDVTRANEVEALVDKTVATYGRLDCAFNNAGSEGEIAPLVECSEENFDRVINVNLKGVWLCMKYEMRQMLKQGSGAIVNMASVAGVVAERGFPAYAAAKGGVIQITRTAAVEYGGTGVRINAICPGAIMTPMVERAMSGMSAKAMAPGLMHSSKMGWVVERMMKSGRVKRMMVNMMHPIGRPGKAEEVAEAVVWLCSDAASFVTGHSMLVDGGMTAA
jgi:NAD(P)-dependent dehydrogenase (short-subunit alcohol dehydrogenase family)